MGVSLPQVGNIFDVTNPGLTTIAYLRHAARSTRPPPPYLQSQQLIIHLLLWDDNAEITTVTCEWKGWQRGKGWRRAEAMPRDGKAASGRDDEGKGCWASGASSASERHDCG